MTKQIIVIAIHQKVLVIALFLKKKKTKKKSLPWLDP